MVTRPLGAIVEIIPINPPGPGVRLLMGEEPPRRGVAHSWEIIPRPKRKSVTEYSGREPGTYALAAVLSYADIDRSIESLIIDMEVKLANPKPPRGEPPVVQIRGGGIPPLDAITPWVLTSIDYDGEEIRLPDGPRTMAEFTMNFIEYVPSRLTIGTGSTKSVAAQASAASTTKAASNYTVKSGDTLQTIAARVLGNQARWAEIGTLNGIRDPRNVTVGQTIRLP